MPFEYAAKLICGPVGDDQPDLAAGQYFTEVNVHNPNDEPADIRKRVALTNPPRQQRRGRTLDLRGDHSLNGHEAYSVDCNYLRSQFPGTADPPFLTDPEAPPGTPPRPYFTGYLIIRSNLSLDVTAVYTTNLVREPEGTVPAIAVERVPERVFGE